MRKIHISNIMLPDNVGQKMINTIYGNLTFMAKDKKIIAITSCHDGEGKTYMTMQLSRTIAHAGKRVVVVDADIGHSHMAVDYGMILPEKMQGLGNYLVGQCEWADVVYTTNINNLFLIPNTKLYEMSSLLFHSLRFYELLQMLSETYDFVVIDTPEASGTIDTAKITSYCEGIIFVVKYNGTKKRDISEVMTQLEKAGCPIIGCVINNVTFKSMISRKRYHFLRTPILTKLKKKFL